MAVIIPYGDPNAHGTIGKNFSFRRQFGKVIFQKAPKPKQPGTEAQITQRNKFKEGIYNWYSLDTYTKQFYKERAKELKILPYSLYQKAHLLNITPSRNHLKISDLMTLNIINPVCETGQLIKFTIYAYCSNEELQAFGYIIDPTNIFNKFYPSDTGIGLFLFLQCLSGNPIMPFGYKLYMKIKTETNEEKEYILKFQEHNLTTDYNEYFLISEDGSIWKGIYYDQQNEKWNFDNLQLEGTNNF